MLRAAVGLAVRAVRNRSVDDLDLGLLAVALEGVQSDAFEAVLTLALLYHSAEKLGENPVPHFTHAATYGTAESREVILGFLVKGDKNIRAFGMGETYGPNGFDYEVVA